MMTSPVRQDEDVDLEKGRLGEERVIDVEKIDSSNESLPHQADEITRVPTARQGPNSSNKLGATISKIITARSNASVIDPGPPPDGGLKAWTQAVMGHLVIFNTWGLISSFSVFQSYYTNTLHLEPSAVSWIGSIQMLGHFSVGIVSGRAFDAGLFHHMIIPGVLCTSLGMLMTSLCGEYWQFFLAQGLLIGFGCGLQFTPAMSLVYTYFEKNKVVALAIVASGSATGGLVYPTIARQLLPKLGFAWMTRIMGFLMLAVGACYCSLLKPRLPPRKRGPLLELTAFREAPYTLYLIGVFWVCFGQYFAFYYIGSYSLNVLHVPYSTSVNVLMVMNGVGVLGRLVPGYIANQFFGAYNTIIPSVIASAITIFCWSAVKSTAGLYVFAVVYGFVSASFQGLFPAVLSSLTKDLSKVGVRNGMGFAIVGIAMLTGPPVAGALIQRADGSYLPAQIWGGCCIFLGAVVMVYARTRITGWTLKARI